MKLFNKTIDRQLFNQYSLGSDLSKQEVVVKIFNPYGNGTWFILNSDPEDPDYLWAIVDLGYGAEVGSVSRSELETYRGRFGMGFERDLSFDPVNAQELYEGLNKGKYYAKGGGVGSSEENTFDKIFLHYGFAKKRGAYGVRPYEHKKLGTYAQIDDKTRSIQIETPDEEYKGGYNVKGVIEFLKSKGFEETGSYADGGGVNVGYNVFNYTDNIYATDEVFKTKALANKFIKEFRSRFANQGYYRDNRLNKISIQDIDLLAIPSNFNPFKKFADGGDIENFSDNQRMIMNQNVEVEHHHEELEDILEDVVPVPAWVVAKMETATQNLSDITHYLDGQKEIKKDQFEEDDDDDDDEIENKEVVEPINVSAGTKAELTKKFTDDAWGNLRGFLKGMEGIDLRNDYTFDYKDEQFEVEPIINSDENGVSNAVFSIFDGDGEEVGEVAYSREGGKQKFTANSDYFQWNNAKFEDGGYFDGAIPNASAYMSTYAKGGEVAKAEVLGLSKNIMGTTDIDMKISGMRKSQDFIVYPISADDTDKIITIQSSTRIGKIDLSTGRGLMSQSHSNGAYFVHFQMDKLTPFTVSESDLEDIKAHIFRTAGSNVGTRGIVSDNSGASRLFADGGATTLSGYPKEVIEEKFRSKANITWKHRKPDNWKTYYDIWDELTSVGRLSFLNWISDDLQKKGIYIDKEEADKISKIDYRNVNVASLSKPQVIVWITFMNYAYSKADIKKWSSKKLEDGGFMNNVYADGGGLDMKYYVIDVKDGKVVSKGFDTEEEAKVKKFEIFEKTDNFFLSQKKMSKNEADELSEEQYANGGGIGFIPMDLEETLRITAKWGGTDIKGVIGILNAMIDSGLTDEDLKPKPTKSGFAYQNAVEKKTKEIWGKIEPKYTGDFKGNMYYSTIRHLVERANTSDNILKRFKPFRKLQKDSYADGGFMNDVYADGGKLDDLLPKEKLLKLLKSIKFNSFDSSQINEIYYDEDNINPFDKSFVVHIQASPCIITIGKEKDVFVVKIGKYTGWIGGIQFGGWEYIFEIPKITYEDFESGLKKAISNDVISLYSKVSYDSPAIDKFYFVGNIDEAKKWAKKNGYEFKDSTYFYNPSLSKWDNERVLRVGRFTKRQIEDMGGIKDLPFRKNQKDSFADGGMSKFDKLSNKVAKQYEGKPVKTEYQDEYGKTYSKAEAKEVGDKVAGKVKAMQTDKKAFGGFFGGAKKLITPSKKYPDISGKQGLLKSGKYVQVFQQNDNKVSVIELGKIGSGVRPHFIDISEVDIDSFKAGGEVAGKRVNGGTEMLKRANELAKEIRKDGESWLDAKKRAFAQLKK